MQVIEGVRQFSGVLAEERRAGRPIGLVPTMGALHPGHVSLIVQAAAADVLVAVTVFVDPPSSLPRRIIGPTRGTWPTSPG